MTLKKEVFRIPFGKGADTKSTDIVLEPGQLEVLENAVFEKTGRLETVPTKHLFGQDAHHQHGIRLLQTTQSEPLPIEITL